ncbi:flavin reductase family protein [Paraburkholderia sp. J76]|uniref:flavin reductase family protein n=1 Tax=Paraburkholderia sp. J76 TaxID=2805439 RepID=UPI002ABD14EB|nr:flavin reductase family protein [Paraburkholderia sp. J76]
MRATLHSIRWLSDDVRELVLKPDDDFYFRPGQYVGIGRSSGAHRCYSLACAPAADNSLALHVRHWPGGEFSDRVLSRARIGDEFDITGPLGTFAFPSGDGPVVMLATGTGVAPFLAMLAAFLPANRHRRITLYWGAREQKDFYATDVLDAWEATHAGFQFVPVLSGSQAGYVQHAAARALSEPAHTHVLACGNPRMIQDAYGIFVSEAANPVATFTSDAFEAACDAAHIAAEPCAPDSAQPDSVRLSLDGRFVAARVGESILSALKTAGLPVMSVCGGKASCGTCLVELEAGWIQRAAPCSRTERDLLACLPEAGPSSRLGCQIRITPELDGLAMRLPSIHHTKKESFV